MEIPKARPFLAYYHPAFSFPPSCSAFMKALHACSYSGRHALAVAKGAVWGTALLNQGTSYMAG